MKKRVACMRTVLCVLIVRVLCAEGVTVQLNEWYMCSPLGHPDIARMGLPVMPNGLSEMRNYNIFFTTVQRSADLYPMWKEIDLDAGYQGPLTADAQGKEPEVSWRKVFGGNHGPAHATVAFFSTWVWVPTNCTATVHVGSYRGSRFSATEDLFFNGKRMRAERADRANPPVTHPVNGQQTTLQQGWNHVFSCHRVGWGLIQNTVSLVLPPEATDARVSAAPPPEIGRRFTMAGEALGSPASEPGMKMSDSTSEMSTAEPAVAAPDKFEEPVVRIWTNLSGKKVRGSLAGVEGDAVRIKLEDGRVGRVPLDELTPVDREYVKLMHE